MSEIRNMNLLTMDMMINIALNNTITVNGNIHIIITVFMVPIVVNNSNSSIIVVLYAIW